MPVKTNRVEIPPYTDRWMMGDRYGEVVSYAAHSGGRRPAAKRDVEDDQHRAASQQLAEIVDRYGTAHVLMMLADVIAAPDSNASSRARKERRALMDARRSLMEGSVTTAGERHRLGMSGGRSNWHR